MTRKGQWGKGIEDEYQAVRRKIRRREMGEYYPVKLYPW